MISGNRSGLEGMWIRYLQSIPAPQGRGDPPAVTHLQCRSYVWPLSVNDGKGFLTAPCGINGLKVEICLAVLWIRGCSLAGRSESRDGSHCTLRKLKVTLPVTILEGKKVTFNINWLSMTGCTGCFHLCWQFHFHPTLRNNLGSLKRV